MKTPSQIVAEMMNSDSFSQWLGISIESISLGACQLSLKATPEMMNGFQIAHGGISYSLADSALAFAANSYGFKAVSIETSISHTKKTVVGDQLIATARELNRGRAFGIYEVVIKNGLDETVALFKGTVSISDKKW